MAISNPQTYVRLKRIELRQLANGIGNLVLSRLTQWPASGEGRDLKAKTENISRRLSDTQAIGDLQRALKDLSASLADFKYIQTSSFFRSTLATARLDLAPDRWTPLGNHLAGVINNTERGVAELLAALPSPPDGLDKLEKIIPDQGIAPLTYEVINGVLRIRHKAALTDAADRRNTEAARDELLDQGFKLTEALHQSNLDARFIDALADMQVRLADRQDVVRLGMYAITFQLMVEAVSHEMPELFVVPLKGYSIGVGMYVAQHPDWIKFSENSAAIEFSADKVRDVYQAGVTLVKELRSMQNAVDPEVPKSLAFLLGAIEDPRRAVKKTVYAAITSISNLVITVIKGFGGIVKAAYGGATGGVKIAASGIVASSILLAAGHVATKISPAAGHVLQTSWLKEAGELIVNSVKKAE